MKLAPDADRAFDLDKFRWRLAEVISWCTARVVADQPATCLRSDKLQPPTYHAYPYPPHERLRLADCSLDDAHEMIEQLAQRRAELLRAIGQYPNAPVVDLANGALLIYYPDANWFDGAAEAVSAGFFDMDDIPAWDTWVAFQPGEQGQVCRRDQRWSRAFDSDFLVSWVPPLLIPNAQEGVNVSPMECIAWASDVDSPFTRSLREAGIMRTSR